MKLNKIKITNRFFYLALLVVSVLTFSCGNKTNVENTDSTEFGMNGGGYILPPTHLIDGTQPEANWIWDSGEIKPRNYFCILGTRWFKY